MIPVSPTLSSLLLLPLAVAAFLLPGWLLNRRLRSPAPELTIFLGSAALLFLLVLSYVVVHVPLTRGPLLAGWTALSLTLAWWAWRVPATGDQGEPMMCRPRGADWLWIAAVALGLLSVTLRAVLDPLSGFDNGFRWDYLARAMLAFGRLDFYPPVKATDFDVYAWCDGIPPLVSTLNFWIYLFTNSNAPALTAARVVAEGGLVLCAIARLARELWGADAGPAAMAVAAASPLLIWAVAMGQDTGLTTLTLVTLLALLAIQQRTHSWTAIFWAGVAAGCGALSREYGLAFVLLGGGILLARRDACAAGLLGLTTAVIAAPWYVRNWVVTGNPLFPHALGGLFPTNSRYVEIMRLIADYWNLSAGHFHPITIAHLLGMLAGSVLLCGTIGVGLAGRKALPVLTAIIIVAGLWLWSLPLTAGGWGYAMRVLAPGVALAAALGGWLGTRLSRGWRSVAAAVLLLVTVDAARRSWHLPVFPFTTPWSFSFAEWRAAQLEVQMIRAHKMWSALVSTSSGGGIVVDSPSNHAEITLRGGLAIPWFSPRLDPISDTTHSFEDVCAALRAADVRLFAINTNNPTTRAFIAAHPFLSTLCQAYTPIAKIESLTIYDLESLKPRKQKP